MYFSVLQVMCKKEAVLRTVSAVLAEYVMVTQTQRPPGYKTFSCSTQLNTKFILLINVKMPTIGILTFLGMINTISESLKAKTVLIVQHFSFYNQYEFHAQLS